MNTQNETVVDTIRDYVAGQLANAESVQAAQLAAAIREAIVKYVDNGGENGGAFSVDAQYDAGLFSVQLDFAEDYSLTVLYQTGTDSGTVASLYNGSNDDELCRLAGLVLSEGWVEGFNG